jgi:O-antigen biosynthesis protein
LNLRPLIIAGMHRSGTSYVASAIGAGGVAIGERLLGPSIANLRGHFEDTDFTTLHMRMLEAHGVQPSGWVLANQPAVEARFEDEARALIHARTHLATWGWKDPRNTLFLDFWSRLLPDARFLFIYRKPWEVVDSLYRRGDWDIAVDPRLAPRAWVEYNARILAFHRARPECSLLVNVQGVANDVAAFAGLVRDRLGLAIAQPPADLFEPSFMHTVRSGSFEERTLATYAPQTVALYSQLEAAADMPSTDAKASAPLNPDDLAMPVLTHWQYIRSLESNMRLLNVRVDNATWRPNTPE